jgi:hypothetical protein
MSETYPTVGGCLKDVLQQIPAHKLKDYIQDIASKSLTHEQMMLFHEIVLKWAEEK